MNTPPRPRKEEDSLPALKLTPSGGPGKLHKASLKEPTRPTTPSDFSRQLFSAGTDYANRPPSAQGMQSSRLFYPEGGPKLALPKLDALPRLDIARSDSAAQRSSILDAGHPPARRKSPPVQDAIYSSASSQRLVHSLQSDPAASFAHLTLNRQTTAETIALIKASIAATDPEYRHTQQLQGNLRMPTRTSTGSGAYTELPQLSTQQQPYLARSASQPHQPKQSQSQAQQQQFLTVTAAAPCNSRMGAGFATHSCHPDSAASHTPPNAQNLSSSSPATESPYSGSTAPVQQFVEERPQGYGDSPPATPFERTSSQSGSLWAARNDDLPTRPGTSRGRPSSALLPEHVPVPGEDNSTPAPTLCDDGAQVLDLSTLAEPCSSEEEGDSRDWDMSGTPARLRPHSGLDGTGDLAADAAAAYSSPITTDSPAAARDGGSKSHCHSSIADNAQQQQQQQHASGRDVQQSARMSSCAAAALADCNPADPFQAWRRDVEVVLERLAFSQQQSPPHQPAILREVGALAGLVEHARKQPESSKWLNSLSTQYTHHTSGASLTMREAISEHVYPLMDLPSAEVLLKACSIVLRVVKSRQQLLEAGKLLYKLSKHKGNDVLFKREGLLEPLLSTVRMMLASSSSGSSNSSANMYDPLVYYNGCLKNITIMDTSNQKSLLRLGAVHILCQLLTHLTHQVQANVDAAGSAGQVSVQVCGVLRNLAVNPQHAAGFVSAGALPALAAACGAMRGQRELALNAARVLSKLTLCDSCHAVIEQDGQWVPLLVQLLELYGTNRAILLRVAFALGNLTTHSAKCRQQVVSVPGALDTLVSLLSSYVQPLPGVKQPQSTAGVQSADSVTQPERSSRTATREECIVKLLRLVANMSIQPDVGADLAARPEIAYCLLSVLEEFGSSGERDNGGGTAQDRAGSTLVPLSGAVEGADDWREELLLNCCAALTNLSYYQGPTNRVLALAPSDLLRHITPLLMGDNEEAVVEAARLYGNFSLQPEVRTYMSGARVVEALLLLLDHSHPEVVYSCIGSLINFTTDSTAKGVLVSVGGVSRLIDVLERLVSAIVNAESTGGSHASEEGEQERSSTAIRAAGETPTSMPLGDSEIDTLVSVCKALCNVCTDDCTAHVRGNSGSGIGSMDAGDHRRSSGCDSGTREGEAGSCSLTYDEADTLGILLATLNDSQLGLCDEVRSVTTRLQDRVGQVQAQLATAELELLPV